MRMENNAPESFTRKKTRDCGEGAGFSVLAAMPLTALRQKWRELFGDPVPQVSAAVLRLAIAFEMQKTRFGELSPETARRLDHLALGKTVSFPLQPGMRIVREWKGHLHVVTVDTNGRLIWQQRAWRSLSEIARMITGTQWSGPAFFGLTEKLVAA